MKKATSLKTMITGLSLVSSLLAFGQFSDDNLAILVAAASANNTTVSVVELNKTTASQTAVQTISIPSTGTNAIRVSGSATSTLYAANSKDGSLFCFTGHNSEATTGNVNIVAARAVVAINNAGAVSLKTTYTGTCTPTNGTQTRCTTTLNNTDFYIGDQGGIFTNGATAASPVANIRGVKAFGDMVYVAQASATATVTEVSTISAITAGTITGLSGLINNNTIQDFYLISSGANGTTFDVLYILRATSNTAGTIAKYSLVNGIWTANGTYTTTFGGFGLAAEKSGTGAKLYVTTGAGALAANSVLKLTDAAGYNEAINIADNTTLYTTATGTIIKGIAFAPKSNINTAIAEANISNWSFDGKTLSFVTLPTTHVEVFALTGTKVASYKPAGSINLNLSKGIYFIRFDNKAVKVFVK